MFNAYDWYLLVLQIKQTTMEHSSA